MLQIDRLHGILVFLKVVELGSVSRGARALGVSAPAVSASLSRLERKVGARLLNRTPRRLTVTSEGAEFYTRCKRISSELDEATQIIGRAGRVPSGILRVGMPAGVGRLCIIPGLHEFLEKNPNVSVEIVFTNFTPYAMDANLDVAIEIGELPPSRLAARRLSTAHYVVCASPSYVAANGTPLLPEELLFQRCLTYRRPRDGRVRDWCFRDADGDIRDLPLTGYMTLNSGEGLVAAARAGLGIIQVADYYARAGLVSGQLVELLPEWKTAGHHISAVYYRPRAVPKVRAFVDFLVALFSRPEWNGTVSAVRRRTKKARRAIR